MSKFGGVPAQEYERHYSQGGPAGSGSRFGGLSIPPELADDRSVWESSGASQLPDIRRQVMDGSSVQEAAAAQPQLPGVAPPKPTPAQAPGSWEDYARGVMGKAADGVTLGYFDEGLAGIASLLNPNIDYETSLKAIRDDQKKFGDENPIAATAANIGGSLITGGGLLSGVGRATDGASRVARLLASTTAGAGAGAVQGFGQGEGGLTNRATSGATGAALGGLVGLAAPMAASGIRRGYQAIADRANVNGALKSLGLSKPSADVLKRTLEADDALSPAGIARIRGAGADAMPADAGPSAATALDTIVQQGGSGGRIAREAIEGRAAAQSGKLTQALDETLGMAEGVDTAKSAIRQSTSAARKSAYDAAYAAPLDYASESGVRLQELMDRVPGDAVAYANRLMKAEGVKSGQIMAKIADDGSVAFETLPDVRQLDYITRALNSVAKEADTKGAMGGQTDIGRAISNLSREIRGTMREMSPDYAKALDTAADPIARVQAIDLGSELLSKKMTRESVTQALGGMSAAERKAVASGLRSQLDEAIANVKAVASDPNIDARQAREIIGSLSSQAARDKISAVLGEQSAAKLFGSLDEAAKAFELRAGVARGSQTYARQEMGRRMNEATDASAWMSAVQGNLPGAGKRLIAKASGMTPDVARAGSDRVAEEIARFLTGARGPGAADQFQSLMTALTAQTGNEATAREIARLMVRPLQMPAITLLNQNKTQQTAESR